MHHTFNPNLIIVESRSQVTRPEISLTVDCLFYEGCLLRSNLNDIAWSHIQRCLGVLTAEVKINIYQRCAGTCLSPLLRRFFVVSAVRIEQSQEL